MAVLRNATKHDWRIVGDYQYWVDGLGNAFHYYTKKQDDDKFYGEFFNCRSKKTTRIWFSQRKMVRAWLYKKYREYTEMANNAKKNREAKRKELEAKKPVLTKEQKRMEKCNKEIARLEANISRHETKIKRSQTFVKNYNKKVKYWTKELEKAKWNDGITPSGTHLGKEEDN